MVFVMDFAVIVAMSCLSGIAAHLAMHQIIGDVALFLKVGLAASSLFATTAFVRGDYSGPNLILAGRGTSKVLSIWNLTLVTLLVVGFITKTIDVYSRVAVVVFYLATAPVLIWLRHVMVKFAMAAGHSGILCLRRLFLFGTASSILEFVERRDHRSSGIVIVGCHFLTPLRREATAEEWEMSLKRDLDAAVETARHLAPEVTILMMPWSSKEAIVTSVDRFIELPTEIHLGPDQMLERFEDAQLSRLGPFVSLQLTRLPLSQIEISLKRVFDLVVSALVLTFLTPLMILVAVLIRFDSPGPVFFLQRRYGFNQRPFRIVKFRTMHTLDDDDKVIRQATNGDQRITRIGRYLRRWNIDELPQLFNVIMGDMSLVGPRPHALAHDEEYGRKIAVYARRQRVKPGITGWAQVNGYRGETDTQEKMEQRVRYDLFYIENWSFSLDLRILLWTALSSRAYRSAY